MDLNKKDGNRKIVEKEFYSSFRSFLWLNQFFCAAPIKLELFSVTQRERFVTKIFSAAHLLYGLILCSAVCFATFLQNQQFDSMIGFLTRILYMGEYIIGTFNLLLVIFGCQYQKKSYRSIFKRLVNVDLKLQKCGVQHSYSSTKTYLKRTMILYSVFLICVIVVDFLYNKLQGNNFLRSSTVYTIPNVVSTLALTQYAMVLHFIRDKLRMINEELKRFASGSFCNEREIQDGKLSIIPVLAKRHGFADKEEVLKNLRRQHAELARLVELLNKCFGLLIVTTLVAAYIILSIQFYAFYKIAEGFDESNDWLTIYTILWVFLHGGKVLLVLYPMNDVTDEQKKTGNLLHEIDFEDRRFKTQVKLFAQQLILEAATPPNAMRLFHLDMTIVATMVGVLTTYLIILIQFDASSREQTKLMQ